MKHSVRRQLARILGGNTELNRKVLCIKRSWDEVEAVINGAGKKRGSWKKTQEAKEAGHKRGR